MQSCNGRACADGLPVARKLEPLGEVAVRRDGVEEDEADGLLPRAPGRAGDAGDRDRDVRPELRPYAPRHSLHHLSRDGAVALEQLFRHGELGCLDRVRVRDDPARVDVAGAANRRQPSADEPAGARLGRRERETAGAAELEHELFHRPLVLGEELVAEPSEQLGLERHSAPLTAGRDEDVDVDLEVARADRHFRTLAVPSALVERARHRRLARPEEAKHAMAARPSALYEATEGLVGEDVRPQATQLARRPGQRHDHAPVPLEEKRRRGAGEAERDRAVRQRGLLRHAADEVGVAKRSHAAVFKALHEQGSLPMQNVSADELATFYKAYGVTPDRYLQALRGDAVQKKVEAARAFAQRTKIPGTPAIIINGQYLVRGNSFDDQLRIASALIAQARAARGR